MGEQKQIGWLVGPTGDVVKYDAALVRRTSKQIRLRNAAELHARARVGLMYVNEVLKACGWECNCIVQSTTSISLDLAGACVDVSIRKPDRIAYVTSKPGWEYKRVVVGQTPDITLPDGRVQKGQDIVKPTAKVTLASDLINDPWVIQIISTSKGSSSFGGTSTAPLYLPVNRDMEDPAKEVAKNVLLTIRNLVGADKFKFSDIERQAEEKIDAHDLEPGATLPALPCPE